MSLVALMGCGQRIAECSYGVRVAFLLGGQEKTKREGQPADRVSMLGKSVRRARVFSIVARIWSRYAGLRGHRCLQSNQKQLGDKEQFHLPSVRRKRHVRSRKPPHNESEATSSAVAERMP